jgi:hypothetical protein
MKECEECRKKLGFLKGYRHPIMGKNHLLCSNCFDNIQDSVVRWREAHLPYIGFFNRKTSYDDKNFIFNKITNKKITAKTKAF